MKQFFFILNFIIPFFLTANNNKNNTQIIIEQIDDNNIKLILDKNNDNDHEDYDEKDINHNFKKNENNKNTNYEKKKEIIFIHGSSSGMHTYHDNPRTSFLGIARNIREKIWTFTLPKSSYENFYKESNKIEQSNYKNKKELFETNRFPLIAGLYFGLYPINQYSKNDENHITQLAEEKILIPFINNFSKYGITNIQPWMFNWGGDLSNLDRKNAKERLIKDLFKNKNNHKKIFVAFSHGGNVLLEALFQLTNQKDKVNKEIINSVQYIFLLGTPISQETEKWIKKITDKSSIQIINIYSMGDYVQTCDLTFSFPSCQRKSKHKKVINLEISYSYKYKNIKPGHAQLYLYTKKQLPQIPLIVDLPCIINTIENELNKKSNN